MKSCCCKELHTVNTATLRAAMQHHHNTDITAKEVYTMVLQQQHHCNINASKRAGRHCNSKRTA